MKIKIMLPILLATLSLPTLGQSKQKAKGPSLNQLKKELMFKDLTKGLVPYGLTCHKVRITPRKSKLKGKVYKYDAISIRRNEIKSMITDSKKRSGNTYKLLIAANVNLSELGLNVLTLSTKANLLYKNGVDGELVDSWQYPLSSGSYSGGPSQDGSKVILTIPNPVKLYQAKMKKVFKTSSANVKKYQEQSKKNLKKVLTAKKKIIESILYTAKGVVFNDQTLKFDERKVTIEDAVIKSSYESSSGFYKRDDYVCRNKYTYSLAKSYQKIVKQLKEL